MNEERPKTSEPKIRVAILHAVPLVVAGMASTLGALEKFVKVFCDRPTSCDRARAYWGNVDVAVTDFETGVDLMRVSRGRGNVLIVTHDDSEAHIRMALEVGVRGYILIGCDASVFIDSVSTVSAGGTALGPAISARMACSFRHQPLTPRELTVLRLVCVGFSNKAIAHRLCLTCRTVKSHVRAIFLKLDAKGRTQASSIAQRRGIVVNADTFALLEDPEIDGSQSRVATRASRLISVSNRRSSRSRPGYSQQDLARCQRRNVTGNPRQSHQ